MLNKKITFWNLKGGVGKTTVTYMFAKLLSTNYKVLLVDCDLQANLSSEFDVYSDNSDSKNFLLGDKFSIYNVDGIDIIPSHIELSSVSEEDVNFDLIQKKINDISKNYDFILFDLSPSITLLSTALISCLDSIYVPMEANRKSIEGLDKLSSAVEDIKKSLNSNVCIKAVFLNKYKKQTLLQRGYKKFLDDTLIDTNIKLLRTKIKDSIIYSDTQNINFDKYKKRKSYRNFDFLKLYNEILEIEGE